jgi:hypothetical protein
LEISGAEATADPFKCLALLQLFESSAEELGAKFGVKQLDLGFDAMAIVTTTAKNGDSALRNGT